METLTIHQVNNLTSSIFIKKELRGEFVLLRNNDGLCFDFMEEAIDFVRKEFPDKIVQLATFNQALLGNACWDNL